MRALGPALLGALVTLPLACGHVHARVHALAEASPHRLRRSAHHHGPAVSSNRHVRALLETLSEWRDSCRLVAGDGRVLADAAQRDTLERLMGKITARALGVSKRGLRRAASNAGAAMGDTPTFAFFKAVHSDDNVTVTVFLVPRGKSIPLHDHPGMFVLSKLLFGTARVTSMDLGGTDPGSSEDIPAVMRGVLMKGPAPVSFSLSPDYGNLHEIAAVDDTAFLDVIFPPYDSSRPITYYKAASCNGTCLQEASYNFGTVVYPET